MKSIRVIYWIATALLCLMMLASGIMYLVNYAEVAKVFSDLGYPAYLVYPLGIAKILGVAAILTKKSKTLKDLAYAGFFYDFTLALIAHINAGDGGFIVPLIALTLLIVSFLTDRKIYG
ncbi:MAG: hypothetical protein JWN60_2486 [Acidobacteria bacterium]|nr:hypothetical protein [Acidobacteriota bacterium]